MDKKIVALVAEGGADLVEIIEEIVRRAVKEEVAVAVRQAMLKKYLTKKELMELTGWSSRQVEYKKAKRLIDYIRVDRKVLFPTVDILAYLEEGRVPARTDKGGNRK